MKITNSISKDENCIDLTGPSLSTLSKSCSLLTFKNTVSHKYNLFYNLYYCYYFY